MRGYQREKMARGSLMEDRRKWEDKARDWYRVHDRRGESKPQGGHVARVTRARRASQTRPPNRVHLDSHATWAHCSSTVRHAQHIVYTDKGVNSRLAIRRKPRAPSERRGKWSRPHKLRSMHRADSAATTYRRRQSSHSQLAEEGTKDGGREETTSVGLYVGPTQLVGNCVIDFLTGLFCAKSGHMSAEECLGHEQRCDARSATVAAESVSQWGISLTAFVAVFVNPLPDPTVTVMSGHRHVKRRPRSA